MRNTPLDAILILLSGGVDSAYMLYHYLTKTSHPVHAHHVTIMNRVENRWRQELTACKRIVERCHTSFRPFGFSTSTFECMALHRTGWDSDVYCLTAAWVAPNLQAEHVQVALGWTADDLKRPEVIDRMNRGVTKQLWVALRNSVNHEGRLREELAMPLMGLTKAEIMSKIPPELLELAWTCRSPVLQEGQAFPCGKCHACLLLRESGRQAASLHP